MPVKASELISRLQTHVEKYGDGDLMLYDEYAGLYKSIKHRNFSVMPGKRFVIECEAEDNVEI